MNREELLKRLKEAYRLYRDNEDRFISAEYLEKLLAEIKELEMREEILLIEMLLNRLEDGGLLWFEFHIEEMIKDFEVTK